MTPATARIAVATPLAAALLSGGNIYAATLVECIQSAPAGSQWTEVSRTASASVNGGSSVPCNPTTSSTQSFGRTAFVTTYQCGRFSVEQVLSLRDLGVDSWALIDAKGARFSFLFGETKTDTYSCPVGAPFTQTTVVNLKSDVVQVELVRTIRSVLKDKPRPSF